MPTGCVVVFDDDNGMVQTLESQNETKQTGLVFKGYSRREDYEAALGHDDIRKSVRVLVVDLAANKDEEASGKFKIKEALKNSYNDLRVPIFIHSGHLDRFEDFPQAGTVFKVGKSADSAAVVFDKIKLMQESGFLDLFCPSGKIETKIMQELHRAFVGQFQGNEIDDIIKSIEKDPTESYQARVGSIFERLAYRALLGSLLAATKGTDGKVEEQRLNAVEFYYRRTSDHSVWTGDIFLKNDKSERVLILTPRCDVAKATDMVLACKVQDIDLEKLATSKTALRNAINDAADFSMGRFRFLPATPMFEGGKVDYSAHQTMSKNDLKNNYSRDVTLSDELINDIAGKFAGFLLRSGVAETEFEELRKYHVQLQDTNKKESDATTSAEKHS